MDVSGYRPWIVTGQDCEMVGVSGLKQPPPATVLPSGVQVLGIENWIGRFATQSPQRGHPTIIHSTEDGSE